MPYAMLELNNRKGRKRVAACGVTAAQAEQMLAEGWQRKYVREYPEDCLCSYEPEAAKPKHQRKPAATDVTRSAEADAMPEKKPGIVEKVTRVLRSAVGGFNAGDTVATIHKGQPKTGLVLSVAGGKDRGKLRVKIDGDTAKYREVLIEDTRKISHG